MAARSTVQEPSGGPGSAARGLRTTAPWILLKGTVGACLRYRVTGLAAEGAFFAVLSLPPLIFGLAGTIGYVVGAFGDQTVDSVKAEIVRLTREALTEQSVQNVIVPTLDAVLERGRADVISIGFVLALWSGSRALNVLIDTITIMHGQAGKRGIVKTRALSFSMYVVALTAGIVVIPLVLAGPEIVERLLPSRLDFLNALYWPTVIVLSTAFIATLYHLAVPERSPWRYDLPGAVLALLGWIGGSYLLRWTLANAIGGTSIYGPLAAPIAILLWLYVIVIALLIGAAFNATFHRLARVRAAARQPSAEEVTTQVTEPASEEGVPRPGSLDGKGAGDDPSPHPADRVTSELRRER